jgi:hypothetical protein
VTDDRQYREIKYEEKTMARSIYDTLNEMNNRPVRNVTVIDNNGNVTKTNSKALKKAKSKNVKEDVKPISSLDSLTDAVENILI